ncbi:Uncharacterized protein Anas_03632 [Armadillidium nasatum]|uniref:Uncharacterized protein n=1 Tax=Armadillidium nasatum TaxID=96803 RepID=A0A5N5T5S6_9CRUS|nr:Uncharacterized protein Anas_03632 [Armadillidium nasatum]
MVTQSTLHETFEEDLLQSNITQTNPWGESQAYGSQDLQLKFEDSFADSITQQQEQAKSYIPLDDSEQYLAGLEKKLARLQGKTQSSRESERKKLINALAKSKDDHSIDLLKSSNENIEPFLENNNSEENASKGLSAVNPQGTLGLVMRKCVPSQVAVSSDELCELLKTDILAKVHDEIESEASKEESQNPDDKGC